MIYPDYKNNINRLNNALVSCNNNLVKVTSLGKQNAINIDNFVE